MMQHNKMGGSLEKHGINMNVVNLTKRNWLLRKDIHTRK